MVSIICGSCAISVVRIDFCAIKYSVQEEGLFLKTLGSCHPSFEELCEPRDRDGRRAVQDRLPSVIARVEFNSDEYTVVGYSSSFSPSLSSQSR